MKKVIVIVTAIMLCGLASVQFAGVQRGRQIESLPDGFKPAVHQHRY